MKLQLQQAPFGLRMPKETQDWVREVAQKEDRSQNYIINKILLKAKEAEREAQA